MLGRPNASLIRSCALSVAAVLSGCAGTGSTPAPTLPLTPAAAREIAPQTRQLIDRITWGMNDSAVQALQAHGRQWYLEQQLHPSSDLLPEAVQAQMAALSADSRPLVQRIAELDQLRRASAAMGDEQQKKASRAAYQQQLNRLARNAAARSVLRDLYSPNQLQQQMTWFWLNHFSIYQGKDNLRALVGDYEDNAIRPHALGKFRDLLTAVVQHPAMLRYLDNDRNAAGHLNENFARELMELHTLGVAGGYSQQDVQELARMLTGVGINFSEQTPAVRPALQDQYVRRDGFEFNPNRHDYGPKQFLGKPVSARGLGELEQAIDRLCRSPATARFVSRKIALFLVGEDPAPALVERMASAFRASDGDIAAVLKTLFASPEFMQSLGRSFKDPMHYVLASVRLAYDNQPIANPAPVLQWLNRLGEPLYGRLTPDGYPLAGSAWNGSGQMITRFEIARDIGAGNAGLFKPESLQQPTGDPFPRLSTAAFPVSLQDGLSQATRSALKQAASPKEWNALLLSSPELMYR